MKLVVRPLTVYSQLSRIVLIVTLALTTTLQIIPSSSTHQTGRQLPLYRHNILMQKPTYLFPAGGRTLFPAYRLVALYGTPDEPSLGALGQQTLPASITRLQALATTYQTFTKERILPTFEIITTVASASPMPDGSYSYPVDRAKLAVWIEAARQNGIYIVLDLQPGRADFLSQAKEYQSLLEQPNVGLALDPEWRLKPTELPLEQIGSVSIDEVNATAQWLAKLTKQQSLPQKLFLLHEFRLSMLPDRNKLDTAHPELAYVVQMDGQGSQAEKQDTWSAITTDPPANTSFGWKNFYAKDSPLRSPQDTINSAPTPRYISYQ